LIERGPTAAKGEGGVSDRAGRDARAALRHELREHERRLHELIGRVLADVGEGRAAPPAALLPPSAPLTPREVEILRLLASGQTNRQIGLQVRLGAGTVRNYLGRIFRKLGVTSRTQAAVRAVELGLVDADRVPG
jgi:DNA-binding NarL/FixJ family response regulator